MTIGIELSDAVLMFYNDLNRRFGMCFYATHILYETVYRQALIVKQAIAGLRCNIREWQYSSEVFEAASVKGIAVSSAPPGSITGRFSKREDLSSADDSDSEIENEDDGHMDSFIASVDLDRLSEEFKSETASRDSRYVSN